MSILAQSNPNQSVEDQTTDEEGFLFGAYARIEAFDSGFTRAHVFSDGGAFPYMPERNNRTEGLIRQEAMQRPVPVYFRRGQVFYDADRDTAAGEELPDDDLKLGQRLRWDGSGYDANAEDSGSINLVQDARGGLRLSSLNPGRTNLGQTGYRAWGQHLMDNYINAHEDAQKTAATMRQLEEKKDELDEDEELEDEEHQKLQASYRKLEEIEDRLDKLVTYLELAYGDSITVERRGFTFMPTGEGSNTEQVQFLANEAVTSLNGVDMDTWISYSTEEEEA